MRRGPQVRGFLVATCRVWFAGNLSRKPLSVNRMMKTFRILAAALLGSALALPANAAEGVEVLHEEATELLFVVGVGVVLFISRRILMGDSAMAS